MFGRALSSRRCPREPEMSGLPSLSRAWPVDSNGRTTFLKLPQGIDLNSAQQQDGLYDGPASIVNLPSELTWSIMALLPAVDRVCLALTCKALTASALSSPHLRTGGWTPWLSDEYFPSRNQLIQRLAHGWVDKNNMRYCQTCYRILPRDQTYWSGRMSKSKTMPWDLKVKLEKEKWKKLSKRKRYDHIIKNWCEADEEDSSVFSCKTCVQTRILGWDRPQEHDVEKGAPQEKNVKAIPMVPVECPACVEQSLTYRWKEPRKPKVRPFLWKWTKKTLSFCGNTILVFIYLLYLLLKAPVDLGMWLWKKYKGNRSKIRRALCLK